MSVAAPLQTAAAKPRTSALPIGGGLLQRKCACGSSKSSLNESHDDDRGHTLQKTLGIGASDDPLEQEADRVADDLLVAPVVASVNHAPPESVPMRVVELVKAKRTAGLPSSEMERTQTWSQVPLRGVDALEREANRASEAVIHGRSASAHLRTHGAVLLRQDAPEKPRDQPTTFPPQEVSKQGQEKADEEKEKLVKGGQKAAGELAKFLWELFSKSDEGRHILRVNERDWSTVSRFFEDFAKTVVGKIVLGATAGSAAAGLGAIGWGTRDAPSSDPDISPSTGGAVPRAPKDDSLFALELNWDFVTPPVGFTLKTPWLETPKIGKGAGSGATPPLGPPPMLQIKPMIPRICTPADPQGDQGEADARSAFIYGWLKHRQQVDQERARELVEKYRGGGNDPKYGPSVLKPLFKRDRRDEESDPEAVAAGLRSPARPLDDGTRSFMESRFGHDFTRVRVHADPSAARSADALQARAFTVGRDIVFAAGEYVPETARGRELLAHELTHTIQQQGNGMPPSAEAVEHEAERNGATIGKTEASARIEQRVPTGIARQPKPPPRQAPQPSLRTPQPAPRSSPASSSSSDPLQIAWDEAFKDFGTISFEIVRSISRLDDYDVLNQGTPGRWPSITDTARMRVRIARITPPIQRIDTLAIEITDYLIKHGIVASGPMPTWGTARQVMFKVDLNGPVEFLRYHERFLKENGPDSPLYYLRLKEYTEFKDKVPNFIAAVKGVPADVRTTIDAVKKELDQLDELHKDIKSLFKPLPLSSGSGFQRVQPKLRMAPLDDPLEREADQMADAVIHAAGDRLRRKGVRPLNHERNRNGDSRNGDRSPYAETMELGPALETRSRQRP